MGRNGGHGGRDGTPALVQQLRGSWAPNPAPGTRISQESERPGGGPAVAWSLYCLASPGQCCRASTHWPSKLLTASRMQGRGRPAEAAGRADPARLALVSGLRCVLAWAGSLGPVAQVPLILLLASATAWACPLHPGVQGEGAPAHKVTASRSQSQGGRDSEVTWRSSQALSNLPPRGAPNAPCQSHAGWAPGKTMAVLSCSRGSSHSTGCSLFLEKARK